MPASPSNEPQPHTLSSEEQVYIGARIANAIRQLLWGIAVPAVYFGALNYWLTGPREFLGLGSAISLILAIGFFATFALTFHLLLAGMADLALFVRYRRDPAIFHRRLEGDTSWLYAPPGPWPKAFNPKGITGKIVNQPLRLLHTETERTYLKEQIAKAKWTIRMCLRALASYAALLVFWQLNCMSTVRAEDGFVATFVIAVFFIPFMVLFFLIKGMADHRKYARYQAEHLELSQRHNRTSQNIERP
jgi:hypothetical protein